MKAKDVQISARYAANVSGERTVVRITSTNSYGGWNAVNEKTGREVRIKTAQRLTLIRPRPILIVDLSQE